jgi:hypothetical protein
MWVPAAIWVSKGAAAEREAWGTSIPYGLHTIVGIISDKGWSTTVAALVEFVRVFLPSYFYWDVKLNDRSLVSLLLSGQG